MSGLKRPIHEIHRRSLWQVLLIYFGAAWGCYELIDTITSRFTLPEWLPALAAVLFLLGLPFVVATAFLHDVPAAAAAREGEAEGHPETAAARHDVRRRHRFLTSRSAGLAFLSALALWGVVAAGWMLVGPNRREREEPEIEASRSIAVLPFENLSPAEEDRFFADGIHDEILTHLTRVGDLKVISRTSVLEYRNSPKNLREIAAELGAAAIVEGTVRRTGDRVRVTAQLIDAKTDHHLWSEVYDRQLADIFAIQADVARRIASALAAELTSRVQERIEHRPTEDMDAYDAYLRGKNYARRGYGEEDIRLSIRMYERAVELDPQFALAWAELAEQQGKLYWFHYDRSDAPLTAAKRAIDRALALDPGLPEAYLARGYYYYWGHLDYDRALRDFDRAREGLPGNARVLHSMAAVRRRQGRFDLAESLLRTALELDPRSEEALYNLAETLEMRRDYDEALRSLDRLITLAPDNIDAVISKARILAGGLGDLEAAWETLEPAFAVPARGEYSLAYYGALVQLYARDYSKALEVLEVSEEEVFETQLYFLPKPLVRARILDFMGRSTVARASYDSARVFLEGRLVEEPEDPRLHSALGLALAGLERKADAIRAGEQAMKLLPMSREAWRGGNRVIDHARILTRVGEAEAAIDRLERMLSVPSELSITGLRLDPAWDPLRDHPRFKALLENTNSPG